MTRTRTGVLALLLAVVSTVATVSPAQAHNELVRAIPADGTSLRHLPATGTLVFAEEVGPDYLTVEVAGVTLPVHQVPGNPNAMTVDLSKVEEARTVVVAWSVVDEHDGHRSGGDLRLHVRRAASASGGASGGAGTGSGGEPWGIGVVSVSAHIVGYLAMALLVGGLLFVSLLWPAGTRDRRTRALLAGSVVAGVVGAVGVGAVVLWRSRSLSVAEALGTDYGRASTSMLLLWLLAAIVVAAVLQLDELAVRRLSWRVGAVIVSAAIIRVAGINAHATQGDARTWGLAADFLHLTAISAWVGGLAVLSVGLLPRRRLEELEHVVPRFSKVALVSVLIIVSSGLVLLWDIARTVDGFWSTHYAHLLVLKLSVFALVMLAAMKSKQWVQKHLADAVATHRRAAVRSFAVSVAAETVLVIAVLSAASLLVTSSPGV